MIKRDMANVLIIGAGVAGLYASLKLREEGHDVVILELENEPGGMVRSIHMDGFIFDMGFHVIHTNNPYYKGFFFDLLRSQINEVITTAKSYYDGSLHYFPPILREIMRLPMRVRSRVLIDLARGMLYKRLGKQKGNFEDQLSLLTGEYLYKKYFKHYTEKFWGIPANQLSAKWVPQRVLPRVKGRSAQGNEWQAYPTLGGIDAIPKALAQKAYSAGVTLNLGSMVVRIKTKADRAIGLSYIKESKEHDIDFDVILSTMPLPDLFLALAKQIPNHVETRSMVYVFLCVNQPDVLGDTSMYFFPNEGVPFTRVFNQKKFGYGCAPNGSSAVEVEFPCWVEDKIWKTSDSSLIEVATSYLKDFNILKNQDVRKTAVYRQRYAYPVHSIQYTRNIDLTRQMVGLKNLFVAGRLGRFFYTDMCGAMESASIAVEDALSFLSIKANKSRRIMEK